MSIKNVVSDGSGSGTLDIYMVNNAGCTDVQSQDQIFNPTLDTMESCCTTYPYDAEIGTNTTEQECSGFGGTWLINPEDNCAQYQNDDDCETLSSACDWNGSSCIPSTLFPPQGNCGDGICDGWFNGGLAGIQFQLSSVNFGSGMGTGGTAAEYGFGVYCGVGGEAVAQNWSGGIIPAGEGVFTTIAYSNYTEHTPICYVSGKCQGISNPYSYLTPVSCIEDGGYWEEDCNFGQANQDPLTFGTAGDMDGNNIPTNWGDCYCPNSTNLIVDACNICDSSYGGPENAIVVNTPSPAGMIPPDQFWATASPPTPQYTPNPYSAAVPPVPMPLPKFTEES
jgi:hypothetical protein